MHCYHLTFCLYLAIVKRIENRVFISIYLVIYLSCMYHPGKVINKKNLWRNVEMKLNYYR